jgi:hypothetical protein
VVSNSVGPACSQRIAESSTAVVSLLQSQDGRNQLQNMFNTCTPIVTDDDVSVFMEALSSNIAGVVQYNDDNVGYQPFDLSVMCPILEAGSDALAAFVNFTNIYAAKTGAAGQCTEVSYAQTIKDLSSTSDGRSWTYQTCTEFGYFQTGESSSQPFSPLISLNSFLKQCVDAFGTAGPNIDWTNDNYGSTDIASVNTVFTNGDVDPWHALGVTSGTPNPGSAIVLIHGTAHCADLYPPGANDVPGLTAARATQLQFLAQWLA